MFVIVGCGDLRGAPLDRKRIGREFQHAVDGLGDHSVLRAVFGRKVKQNGLHIGVSQMRRDLCAHDTGTQHGNFADMEMGNMAHALLLVTGLKMFGTADEH